MSAGIHAAKTNKPLVGAAFLVKNTEIELLDLRFFIRDMLACFRIKLHDLHFRRRGSLVFGSRVEVTRTGGRF
mgnify:CR=1 FL=1